MAVAYDPESGRASQSARMARRFLMKRTKWIVGCLAVVGVVVYLFDLRGPGPPGYDHEHGHGHEHGHEMGWDGPPDKHHGGIHGWFRPGGGAAPPPPPEEDLYEVPQAQGLDEDDEDAAGATEGQKPYVMMDTHGNKHYAYYRQPNVAPAHPDLTLLSPPSALFPEIDLSDLRLPAYTPFPSERVREIVSEYPKRPRGAWQATMDNEAFSQYWVGPDGWDEGAQEVGKVQFDFTGVEESEGERQVREDRRQAVKRGFAHAWQGYKEHAWGESGLSDDVDSVVLTSRPRRDQASV
jgi:mannosyl-oligosaccharide alpha-1,2-mannosidase